MDAFCQLLVRTGLLSAAEVQDLRQRFAREAGPGREDSAAFARWLIDQQFLTAYQADRLIRGQADHYFFNQYRLLDRLGQGRMAGVYKAVHPLGQVVAIKVLPPRAARDPVAFARFQREAWLAVRLRHPHVVRTFQTGVADGLHYLVMEYLDGETLEEVLKRRGKLPPDEAVRLLCQALAGLQHLHEQGMVHRDLKPANLMLVQAPSPGKPDTTHQATLKILDVGVGRSVFDELAPAGDPELTGRGDILGDPDYLAPEQAQNAHQADIRADIYSLGCVLFHTLTGQPPFMDSNMTRKVLRHATESPRPLRTGNPTLPARLQPVLDRMLAKKPTDRYPTPALAAAALASSLAASIPASPPAAAQVPMPAYETWLEKEDPNVAAARRGAAPAVSPPAPHRPGRRPVAAAAAVGVAVILAAGLAIAVSLRDRPQPQPRPEPAPLARAGEPALPPPEAPPKQPVLSPEEQVRTVVMRLREANPGFDGRHEHVNDGHRVTELRLIADLVTDLGPLRGLPDLKDLSLTGSGPGKGRLSDLTPLRGLALRRLNLRHTAVTDLTPLTGMPLEELDAFGTPLSDLAAVRDLPLRTLNIQRTLVRDLAPLADLPLRELNCDLPSPSELEAVKAIKTLTRINGQQPEDLLQQVAGPGDLSRLEPTRQFAAEVVEVMADTRRLKVRLRQPVLFMAADFQNRMDELQTELKTAPQISDPVERNRAVQGLLDRVDRLRKEGLQRHAAQEQIELPVPESVPLRSVQPPVLLDAKGKPRRPTPAELKLLRSTDPKLPGYRLTFAELKPLQRLEIHVGELEPAAPGTTAVTAGPRIGLITVALE